MAESFNPVFYGMLARFEEVSSMPRDLFLQNHCCCSPMCRCVAVVAGTGGGQRPVLLNHRHTGPEHAKAKRG